MININNSLIEFEKYVENFNMNEPQIKAKVVHTYHVMAICEKIAESLRLNEIEIKLAKLIGLLHDIGRFDEVKMLGIFDSNKFNHAIHGCKILFDKKMIRKFVETDKYDSIIQFAILNHNKLEIEKTSDKNYLLYAQIIRDADKIDSFRVKVEEELGAISPKFLNSVLENDVISPSVLKTFFECKTILDKDRKTTMDMWLSYIAFVFDFNFIYGLKYLQTNNCINKIIDRVDYKNNITKLQMEDVREFSNKYIDDKVKNKPTLYGVMGEDI